MSAVAAARADSHHARMRAPGPRHAEDIAARLRRVTGQVAGVEVMYEHGRYCIDVLDQLSAARAALDSVALLILQDHINLCVREAIDGGDADDKVAELVTAVRRYVRSR